MTQTRSPIRRVGRFVTGFAIFASAIGCAPREPDAFESLVAAERRFAADAGHMGVSAAFRAHVAPDGILIQPTPLPAAGILANQQDGDGLTLEWQPRVAAVSRSNDLGYTTGPYNMRAAGKRYIGNFVTIWTRGSDGRWRWFLDFGLPPSAQESFQNLPTSVRRQRPGSLPDSRSHSAGHADDMLNAAIGAEGWGALAGRLSDEAQILRPGEAPASRRQAGNLLAAEAKATAVRRLGLRVSKAGDLASSYGRVERADGQANSHYLRVWRLEKGGWRLLLDEVV